MTSVRALRLTDVAPPPALAEAVSAELLARINMREIPVLLMRKQLGAGESPWLGFCAPSDTTESGEVVIDARCVERSEWEPQPELITSIYLHEAAHRLLPNYGHTAAFFAMVLVLYLRAGTGSIPFWQRAKLYDLQDEGQNAPQAFAWAWRVAHELAATDLPAERCAEVIEGRYRAWRTWLAGADERAQAKREEAHAAEQRIKSLKESRWWCALAG
ncbi:hypothetical protein, partial [Ralstonia solanacearum]